MVETFNSNFMLCKLSQEFGVRSSKCTPVNGTSFDISCHLSLPPFELVQIENLSQLVDLQFSCWCIWQAIKQEIVCTLGQLKLTHINFAILNSHVTVIYLRFIKNAVFMWYHRKIENTLDFFISNLELGVLNSETEIGTGVA